VLPEGQEMKKEIEDAASNRANGPKRVIVTASLLLSGGPNLLSVSAVKDCDQDLAIRRFGVKISSDKNRLREAQALNVMFAGTVMTRCSISG
jgi:hypothetical protein